MRTGKTVPGSHTGSVERGGRVAQCSTDVVSLIQLVRTSTAAATRRQACKRGGPRLIGTRSAARVGQGQSIDGMNLFGLRDVKGNANVKVLVCIRGDNSDSGYLGRDRDRGFGFE